MYVQDTIVKRAYGKSDDASLSQVFRAHFDIQQMCDMCDVRNL
jgi:hypothetical protein